MSSPYCMTSVISCLLYIGFFSKIVKQLCCFKTSSFSCNSAINWKIQLSKATHGRVGAFNMQCSICEIIECCVIENSNTTVHNSVRVIVIARKLFKTYFLPSPLLFSK